MNPKLFLTALASISVIALGSLFAAPVRAAPSTAYLVNNSGDAGDFNTADSICETVPTSGTCTLRAAIQQANAHAGSDSISFSIIGTIVLGSMLPAITDTLTINGPGEASLTISGNNTVRVMQVNSGVAANLSNVTIANGKSFQGSGIQISGTLSVSNTTFFSNSASGVGGAIVSDGGTLTVTGSTFYSNTTGSGGGIYNYPSGTVNVSNSTFYSNSVANSGAGIGNEGAGTVNVSNSTFYSNTAGNNGGGIYIYTGTIANVTNSTFYSNTASAGGGIANTGTLAITNSTLYRNTGSIFGGGLSNTGIVTMTNSTLAGNSAPLGGGILASNFVHLRNTIIADSPSGGNCNGSITSLGYNLDSGNTCSLSMTGDISNTNPLLAPLASNGGATKTVALFPGSAAMNRIPNGTNECGTTVTTDQRGVARPQGTKCDIGAFEYQGTIYPLFLPLIFK